MALKNFLISASPRSGGHVLMGILQACEALCYYTHDPLCRCKDYSDVCLLILTRKDAFATVMSNCLCWYTNQTTIYHKTNIEPIEIEEQFFIDQCVANLTYVSYHDLSRGYGRIENLVLEDVVNDYDKIVEKLGLERRWSYDLIEHLDNKAPYNYLNKVINKDRLREIFDNLDVKNLENFYARDFGKDFADFDKEENKLFLGGKHGLL